MISRRKMLGALLASAVATPALAEGVLRSPRPLSREGAAQGLVKSPTQPAISDPEALIAAADLSGGLGYVVVEAKSGRVLEEKGAGQGLPPASVAKALTALYALETLGPDFRFHTRLLSNGVLKAGVLHGDLILKGDGDPTLQTDDIAALVRKLRQAGVKEVRGGFFYDATALPNLQRFTNEQPVQVGYDTGLSGLNANFNRVQFEWARKKAGEWTVEMNAPGETVKPVVRGITMQVASRSQPVYSYKEEADREAWSVASDALGKAGSRWLPVRRPAAYTAEIFATLAADQGIKLAKPMAYRAASAQASSQEIVRHSSQDLPSILRDMLKFSTNITAEAVGLRASGAADLAASGRAISQWLTARFGVKIQLVDHSGLGGGSRVTASDMVAVLLKAYQSGLGLENLLRDVGMKDDAGKVVKGHPVKVKAKTGTLNFVSGLAGYVIPPNGQDLVFAIFTGDPARRDAVPLAAREAPEGGVEWARRSRRLQGQLVRRWSDIYA